MTEPRLDERLRDLLPHLVADVDAPPMARAAWTRAGRVRRRRRAGAVGAIALTTAGIAATVAGVPPLAPRTAGPVAPATASSPTSTGTVTRPPAPVDGRPGPRVAVAPPATDLGTLPGLETSLAALSGVPASAPSLGADPLPVVVAAVQWQDGPVLVLGPEGRWRRVDADQASPAAGPPQLTPASISPDGRRLALHGPGGIVLVDVATGGARSLPVTGPVTGGPWSVRWFPGGDRILVTGDGGSAVVSTTDGTVRPLQGRYRDLVRSGPGGPTTELSATELVVHPDAAAAGPAVALPLAAAGEPPVRAWYGLGHLDSGRVASSGFTAGDRAQVVSIVEVATGRLTDVLQLSYEGRSPGCCPTLGWLDGDTVLLRDGPRVLAWRLGEDFPLLQLAELPAGVTVVDVAPRGAAPSG